MKIVLLVLAILLIGRIVQILVEWRTYNSPKLEGWDLSGRLKYLLDQVVLLSPKRLIRKMPKFIGKQFQGEWAIYTLAMTTLALTNFALRHPKFARNHAFFINKLIVIALSPFIWEYDSQAWNEHPMMGPGNGSHLSYHSLLALMISCSKALNSCNVRWDGLFDGLITSLVYKMKKSDTLCIETYPGEMLYVPDNLAAVAAIANYAKLNNGKFRGFVDKWIENAKNTLIDEDTGLIKSCIDSKGESNSPILGSYTALSIYYLTFIDPEFAKEQYERFKKLFFKKGLVSGIKETIDGSNGSVFTIDSGPVILGLSPTGTAFSIGPATFFDDKEMRTTLLRTGEIAGLTVPGLRNRHYLLGKFFLVGEAIVMAMRTATEFRKLT